MTKEQVLSKMKEKIQSSSTQVEGRTSLYNPLLQKPVRLEPIGPGSYPSGLGGYSYLGPPPDFGGSYGSYVDSAGRKQYGIMSSKIFNLYDGTPVALHSELSPEERDALLAQMDEMGFETKCQACRSELLVSIASPLDATDLHCPYCATVMGGTAEAVKMCKAQYDEKHVKPVTQENVVETPAEDKPTEQVEQEGNMAKQEVVQAKKEDEGKVQMGSDAKDIAKEGMKLDAPKDLNAEMKPAKVELMEHADSAKKVEEYKAMDEAAKELAKASTEAPAAEAPVAAAPAPVAAPVATPEADQAKVEAAVNAFREKRKAQKTEAKVEEMKARRARIVAAAQKRKLEAELRTMAVADAAQFEEVKKHPKMAAICAEVEKKLLTKEKRVAAAVELADLIKKDPAKGERVKAELQYKAPEILVEMEGVAKPMVEGEPVAEAPVAEEAPMEMAPEAMADEVPMAEEAPIAEAAGEACEANEEEKKEEEKEEKEAEAAVAMQIETLANIAELPGTRVEMSLYAEETENPFWNVTVDAEPVGRIFLQDYENPEQIRASFVADSYPKSFAELVQRVGLTKVLDMTKARIFAHRIDETEIGSRIREQVKAEVKAEFDAKVETVREDFLRAVETAVVAANKNLYSEESRNALKGGLFNSLVSAGLSEDGAVWAIEKGFESAPEFFKFVTAKAKEIMDNTPEARSAIEKLIAEAGVQMPEVEQPSEEKSLVERLVKSSAETLALGGVLGGENREEIRKQLGFASTRR